MSYLALYRKYRPDTFDKLIGQEHIVKTLVNQIETGRIGHAYLFTGTRGTGKTSAAKIFARAINCLSPINGSPCGKCAACTALSDPSNIDISEIDAASNNGVNEIRDLREKVQYPPVSCRYKVYIIDEVHMLSGAAFNALLKTLEEPPSHAVFILATTEAHKIPATILSRCMRFDFRLIPTEKIAALIADIYNEQGKKFDNEAVYAIAAAGEGSIRDALSIADIAISYGDGKLTYKDVTEILGSSGSETLSELAEKILKGDAGGAMEVTDRLCSLGKSMGVLCRDIIALMRNILIIKTCKNAPDILSIPEDQFVKLAKTAEGVAGERVLRAMEIFSDAENSLRYTTHPRVLFETAAIKAAKPAADYNIDALLSRVKALEDKLSQMKAAQLFADGEQTALRAAGTPMNATLTGKPAQTDVSDMPAEAVPVPEEDSRAPETIAEPSPVNNDGEVTSEHVKGKLLSALRKPGSEMLWNVMQNVDITYGRGVICLRPKNSADHGVIDLEANRRKIEESLAEFQPFELKIAEPDSEKQLDALDEATERIKQIFGDDIVIVKD